MTPIALATDPDDVAYVRRDYLTLPMLAQLRDASLSQLESWSGVTLPAATYQLADGSRWYAADWWRLWDDAGAPEQIAGLFQRRYLAAALLERGWLLPKGDTFEATPPFLTWLGARGHPPSTSNGRPLTRACLDGTERLPHLAGASGAALAALFVAERWVARRRHSRSLRVTDRGRRALIEELGLVLRA